MKNPIYVIGHKNPDIDSIVSAIAYAEYKRQCGEDAVAARIGRIGSDCEYLLERFGFDEPKKLYSAKQLLKEIEMDKPAMARKNITIQKALKQILKVKNRGLAIIDHEKKLEGIITIGDISRTLVKEENKLEEICRTIKIDDLNDTVNGSILIRKENDLSGKVNMFPDAQDRIEKGNIVLLRNDKKQIKKYIDNEAAILIINSDDKIDEDILDYAQRNNSSIILCKEDALITSRSIYQSIQIEHIMKRLENIDLFDENDTVEEATRKISSSRHRSYPVLNDQGKIIGSISRYHLFNHEKKRFILVDHNEKKQTIEDIRNEDIIEIVDHHRLGGFESNNPIPIKIMNVGATATIIADIFFRNSETSISINMAGLLLGAIISDTMNLKSPTTTTYDKLMVRKLEELSGIKADDLAKQIIENSDSLLSKRMIEILYDDYKEYVIDGNMIGISQTSCRSQEEYESLKDDLQKYLEDSCISTGLDLLMLLLTNPNGTGSFLMAAGKKRNKAFEAFKCDEKGFVKNLVSRKKQVFPEITRCIKN